MVDSILQEEGVDGIQMVVVVDGNQMEVDDIQVVVVDSIQVEGVADGMMEVVGWLMMSRWWWGRLMGSTRLMSVLHSRWWSHVMCSLCR